MSAPSGPIQIIPPGLLNALQIKNNGRLPDELIGTYQPVIEMRDWLLQFNGEFFGYFPAAAVVGATYTLFETVPNDEWWYIHEASAVMVVAAGAAFACVGIGYAPPGFTQAVLFADRSVDATVAPISSVTCSRSGVWVPAGSEIKLYRDSNVAPPINSSVHLRISRLGI